MTASTRARRLLFRGGMLAAVVALVVGVAALYMTRWESAGGSGSRSAATRASLFPLANRVARWTFVGQFPPDWTIARPSVEVQGTEGGALAVTTEPQKAGYVLMGPVLVLKPGRYRLGLIGDVVRGGVGLGVLDAAKNAWIEQSVYSSSQHFAGRAMVTSFTLTTRERVQPILTNWRPTDGTSSWRLRELDLVRVGL